MGTLFFLLLHLQQVAAGLGIVFPLAGPVLDCHQELIEAVLLLLTLIELAAQLEQVPEELHGQGVVSQVLAVAAERRVETEPNAVPLQSLVVGVHESEAVERVVTKVESFEVATSQDHVEAELAHEAGLEVLEGCLL